MRRGSRRDEGRARWNQLSTTSEVLAAEYDVRDADGSQPRAWIYIPAMEDGSTTDVGGYR